MSKEQYTHVRLQNRKRCLKVCDEKRNVCASNYFFFYNVGCEKWKDRRTQHTKIFVKNSELHNIAILHGLRITQILPATPGIYQ